MISQIAVIPYRGRPKAMMHSALIALCISASPLAMGFAPPHAGKLSVARTCPPVACMMTLPNHQAAERRTQSKGLIAGIFVAAAIVFSPLHLGAEDTIPDIREPATPGETTAIWGGFFCVHTFCFKMLEGQNNKSVREYARTLGRSLIHVGPIFPSCCVCLFSVEKSKKSAESARMMQQSELEALQNTDLFKRLNAKTKVGTHM